MAIIAALSVVNLNSGRNVRQPRLRPSSTIPLRSPESVSYTHLDVYKRQTARSPFCIGPLPGRRPCALRLPALFVPAFIQMCIRDRNRSP